MPDKPAPNCRLHDKALDECLRDPDEAGAYLAEFLRRDPVDSLPRHNLMRDAAFERVIKIWGVFND